MPTLDFVTMVTNLSAFVTVGSGDLWIMVTAVCWLMASVFGVAAAYQLKTSAEDGRGNYRAPLMSFVGAVLMSTAPSFIGTVATTFYGNTAFENQPLSYNIESASNTSFNAVMAMVSFIGYCFFVRGIWVLKESGEPQKHQGSTVGKAIAILSAGMAAIYIDVTLKMLAGTFGWDVSTYLN